jgi:hypothetical protein
MDDKDAIARLISDDIELSKMKHSLTEILADPDVVNTSIKVYLKSIIYHNLAKVRALYKIVFKVDLFTLLTEEERKALFKSIEYRHDCVHRNGRDKEGKQLDVFIPAFVQAHSDMLKKFVEAIEKALEPPDLMDFIMCM